MGAERYIAGLAGIVAVVATAVSPAALARPDYADFVRQSIYVPVRDGTRLAVNIYRPANGPVAESGQLPVIFVFTPYRARIRSADGKVVEAGLSDHLGLRSLIRAGYVVAVADIRGKGASFGARRGFQDRTEAQDGYDLVQWLAAQPFATGKVGMVGCSYLGGTVFHTASTTPPALKAVFIGATDIDKYGFVRQGGITAQFNTRPDEPLSDDLASLPVDADADGAMLRSAVAEHARNTPMAALWYSMPFRDSVSPLTGNAFWDEAAVYKYIPAIRQAGIATYVWGNWRDEPTMHTLFTAASLNSRALLGPGNHCVPPPGFDFTGELVRYFDYHLKGVANGFETAPKVTYWVDEGEGKGRWVRSANLPGTGSRRVAWYLDAGRSGTARSVNDGLLTSRTGARGSDSFTVDYNLPSADYFAFWAKPMDAHGLSYTGAPLTSAVHLSGFPVVHLKVSTDKADAPIFAYLDEVNPAGEADVVSFGRLLMSHRKAGTAPYNTLGTPWHSGRSRDVSPVAPGKPIKMSFALSPVSRVVRPGYRLRLTITGADPRQRNLAQIRQDPAPVITVHRGKDTRVDLPVE